MFFQNGSKFIGEDIEYICRLMFNSLQAPIYFFDNNNDIYYSLSLGHADNPVHPNMKGLFLQLFHNIVSSDFPIIKSTKYFENYAAVTLNMDDIFVGTFVIGPSTYSYITSENIAALISDNGIPISYKRDLINYFNKLPIIDYTRLVNASILLYYSIYNKKLDINDIIEKNSSNKNANLNIKNEFENIISTNRQNTVFHHTLDHERITMKCIREGNKEKLLEHIKQPMDGEYGILSKNNPLRSDKNLIICGVALVTRTAIEGGLDSEIALSLSDSYIQAVEEVNSSKDLFSLYNKMLCDFTDRVHAVRELNYSKTIVYCQNYIFKYLYKEITLKELAEVAGLSPNYLSELFSKEVGITITEYIQKEKIEEAKRLLTSSNYSIMDISTWLNFHDQSHFTRLFKKFTGTTPKKYRDNGTSN